MTHWSKQKAFVRDDFLILMHLNVNIDHYLPSDDTPPVSCFEVLEALSLMSTCADILGDVACFKICQQKLIV